MDFVNQHFGEAGFRFNLVSIDYVPNDRFSLGYDEEGLRHSLHKGDYSDVNLYFVAHLGGAGGVAAFPVQRLTQGDLLHDGAIIVADTVPGSRLRAMRSPPNPTIVTHEIGHLMGLLHTFQGGCGDPGDGIQDTASQQGPSRICAPTYSCGSPDPVDNFMDYAPP